MWLWWLVSLARLRPFEADIAPIGAFESAESGKAFLKWIRD